MRDLLLGFLEFREQSLLLYRDRFRELSEGQTPDTLFIACSDSRVVPSLLASADPGELFTMRNVGNLIPPAKADGTSSGDLSEASAIEYAVSVLAVREHRRVRPFELRRPARRRNRRRPRRRPQSEAMARSRATRTRHGAKTVRGND